MTRSIAARASGTRSVCLKSDERRLEHKAWSGWLGEVARSRRGFADLIQFDPLSNETASMSVLAAAATRSGLLAMTDFICDKHQPDRRMRFRRGRGDLWVGSPDLEVTWAFEAKQVRCKPGTRTTSLETAMVKACEDAAALPAHEGDRAFGILIATLPKDGETTALEERLTEFAETTHFAWRLGGGARPAFAFFKMVWPC